ncbi:MAG: enoyl-CoA hydratase [Burkholderiaceae bacterium]
MAVVHVERDGPQIRLIFDNPAKRNAMTLGMWRTVAQAVARAEADPDVRVIVIRGQGDKAFVSGADISEFETQRSDPAGVSAYGDAVRTAQRALSMSRLPVVAVVQGVCFGGGLGLALSADIRYCARDARFRMPAARLGLGYAFDGSRRMVECIGAARAAELFMTARIFDGAEAERIGVVHQAFDAADLDAQANERIAMISGNAPLTMAAAKLAIHQAGLTESERDLDAVAAAVQACFDSDDYKEGRRAFMEKRAPNFQGW